jgi:ribonucleoside-diphosphate reductase alpha subunit
MFEDNDLSSFSPPSTTTQSVPTQYVEKRDGRKEPVSFDKITRRIQNLCYKLPQEIDPMRIVMSVLRNMPDGIVKTSELDVLAYTNAIQLSVEHPGYGVLAARILINNYHKNTESHEKFSDTIELLYQNNGKVDPKGNRVRHINREVYQFVMAHRDALDAMIKHDRDYITTYSGWKTLEDKYFLCIDGKPIERKQHLLMRVAVGIHRRSASPDVLKDIEETYNLLSLHKYIHATPTLFNIGTEHENLASCFLTDVDDSIDGMYSELVPVLSRIAKGAGGIGVNMGGIRAKGSFIRSAERPAQGAIPFLQVLDKLSRHINQSGKRPASIACYYPIWYREILEILESKKETTHESMRANALFFAMWIDNLFMERVENDEMYTLLCPDQFPGLQEVYGQEFVELYTRYEKEIEEGKHSGKNYKRVKAREIWEKVYEVSVETGNPYILFKDHCNMKNNQANLGTLKGSNLCAEILEYSRPDEVAVCNLASICLPRYVKNNPAQNAKYFDHEELHKIVKIIVNNLNNIIDIMEYPDVSMKKSNLGNRPMGIGVSGLADTFIYMRYPFDSTEARLLNREIFETMYHAAIEASCELAEVKGTYKNYAGSPISKGKLQFDLWADMGHFDLKNLTRDWQPLRDRIAKSGVYNSLLIALMPTASTSFLTGYTECFEPRFTNLFRRDSSTGNFPIVNEQLIQDLIKIGKWTKAIEGQFIDAGGSIQNIPGIPDELKLLYRTVWEIKQSVVVEMSADRGPFVDQTQSMNISHAEPTMTKWNACMFGGWRRGLKTGLYYYRTPEVSGANIVSGSKSSISNRTSNAPPQVSESSGSEIKKIGSRTVICTDDVCVSCQT